MEINGREKDMFKELFGLAPRKIPASAVMTPFLPVNKFGKGYPVACEGKGRLYDVRCLSAKSGDLCVVRTGPGSSLAGDAALFLARAGVERIIFCGSCGGLGDCNIGDIIVAESAFEGEGFSRYFGGDATQEVGSVEGDADLIESLSSMVDEIGGWRGSVFSIGSIAAETRELMKTFMSQGVLGVEMELSAVYTAAAFTGIKAAGILFVSDTPMTRPVGTVLTRSEKQEYNESVRQVMDISVKALSGSVEGSDK